MTAADSLVEAAVLSPAEPMTVEDAVATLLTIPRVDWPTVAPGFARRAGVDVEWLLEAADCADLRNCAELPVGNPGRNG